jgi:hypothetical protein
LPNPLNAFWKAGASPSRFEGIIMVGQIDLFAAPPPAAPPPTPTPPGEVVYEIVPKGQVFAINWRCGDQIGVVGGLYADVEEAQRCIEFRRELRAQGIKDPRPWMRIPPEGVRP